MAPEQHDAAPSPSHLESSEDSSSQDSDNMRNGESSGARKPSEGKVKKPANSKDPNRVKRKKARRACENCQRAHLTCSDNRPCERCGDKKICKDGKRKKEKEAEQAAAQRHAMNIGRATRYGQYGISGMGPGSMYPGTHSNPAGYPLFPSSGSHTRVSQPYGSQMLPMPQPYQYGQQSQNSTVYNGAAQPNMPMRSSRAHHRQLASDLFPDIDLQNNDFENNYGFGEYHALGQMSSGVADTPPSEGTGGFDTTEAKYPSTMMSTSYGSNPPSAQQYQYRRPDTAQGSITYNLGGQGDSFEDFVKQEENPKFHGGPSLAYLTPMSGPSPQGASPPICRSTTSYQFSTGINNFNDLTIHDKDLALREHCKSRYIDYPDTCDGADTTTENGSDVESTLHQEPVDHLHDSNGAVLLH